VVPREFRGTIGYGYRLCIGKTLSIIVSKIRSHLVQEPPSSETYCANKPSLIIHDQAEPYKNARNIHILWDKPSCRAGRQIVILSLVTVIHHSLPFLVTNDHVLETANNDDLVL
jgi:hypothetical protein